VLVDGHLVAVIAKALGATVTAVTSSSKVPLVQSLGADKVVDYRAERFTDGIRGQDVVFDTIGKQSLASCRPVLAPGGRYLTPIPSGRAATQAAPSRLSCMLSGGRAPTAHMVSVQANGEQLERIAALMRQRRIRSIIDTVYALRDARQAYEKSRSWRTHGKLVLRVRTDTQGGVARDAPRPART
jgi:NADPH:quinone reductase-like Zn-dependent oxidoreductase